MHEAPLVIVQKSNDANSNLFSEFSSFTDFICSEILYRTHQTAQETRSKLTEIMQFSKYYLVSLRNSRHLFIERTYNNFKARRG